MHYQIVKEALLPASLEAQLFLFMNRDLRGIIHFATVLDKNE